MTRREVAVMADDFPPCSGGGIAEWARGIADCLGRAGNEVVVLSHWKKKSDLRAVPKGPYSVRPMFGHDWRKYRFFYAFYHLWNFLKKHPRGVVVAATWELASPMRFLSRLFQKAGLVIACHGLEVTRIQHPNRIRLFRRVLAQADLIVAVSRFTREEVLKRLAPGRSHPVVFIPNGIDVRRFRRQSRTQWIRKKWDIPRNAKIILTLARIIPRKGHDIVLRALPRILAKFPNTMYMISGPSWDESYLHGLQKLIRKLRMESHVRFTGAVPDRDLQAFYSVSDVYVMVSRMIRKFGDSEGFGITFLEANACGSPVIGSRSGGIPDAIEDGVNGFLVESDDPDTLAEKILFLFKNPDFSKHMADAGRRRVEKRFAWDRIASQVWQAYLEHSRI